MAAPTTAARAKKALANSEPSTHGPALPTWAVSQVGSYLGYTGLPSPLQSEHEQHRLVAHLAKLRRVDEPGPGVAAEPRQDGDVLLAAGLEGHRRRVDAGADIDLPQLLKAYVVIGAE